MKLQLYFVISYYEWMYLDGFIIVAVLKYMFLVFCVFLYIGKTKRSFLMFDQGGMRAWVEPFICIKIYCTNYQISFSFQFTFNYGLIKPLIEKQELIAWVFFVDLHTSNLGKLNLPVNLLYKWFEYKQNILPAGRVQDTIS